MIHLLEISDHGYGLQLGQCVYTRLFLYADSAPSELYAYSKMQIQQILQYIDP
jgi:hypothetical protein